MLKTSFKIIFENIFLHLHRNSCQNIGTPPLRSYRATPTLLEGDPCPSRGRPLPSQRATTTLASDTMVPPRRVGVALQESRGRPIGGQGWGPYILAIILVQMQNHILKINSKSGFKHKMLSLLRRNTIIFKASAVCPSVHFLGTI